jgi:hypothetical protein
VDPRPVLQLVAAALNFAVVVITGRPAFTLPFNSLDQVLAATPFPKAAGSAASASRATPASTPRAGVA